jgi:hypothetical protein
MMRALILIALIVGIIVGGLLVLKRTSHTGVPKTGDLPRKRIRGPDEKEDGEDGGGW